MFPYREFTYLYPPRPETSCDSRVLGNFERRGWVAQIKKNGTCSVIFVSPEGEMTAMTRHGEPHKAWKPTPKNLKDFAHLKGKGWHVFAAELLDGKTKGTKNVLYVYDVLVSEGEMLVGMTQQDRQDLLLDLLLTEDADEQDHQYVVSPTLWLTMEYDRGFDALYDGLTAEEDEGLVLKDPTTKLSLCTNPKSNIGGQVKCRKPHKNYTF